MTFGELAKYLHQLEGTSSRLEMTRILAQLFREVTPEEGKVVAYLCQGRLGPAYNNPDFGVADKMMVRALGEKAGELFKKLGDLGKVAEEIRSGGSHHKDQGVQVHEVYEKLGEIAKANGSGSQEVKMKLIRELVEELDPVGAKYAVKMVLGKMRTGFSDMTVLDALSWMKTGDKSLRPKIEAIYNVRADLGEVVKLVKSKDLERIEVTPEMGTPVLPARAERAKSAAEIWERNGESAAEHKLDGLRIQAHISKPQITNQFSNNNSVKLFSRGLDDVTAMYPDVVEGLERQVKEECILDGEMIAVDPAGNYLPFQETVQRKRKYDILEMLTQVPLKYYAFDILMAEGRSLLGEKNEARWKVLEKTVKREGKQDTVKLMPREIVKNEMEIEKFFEASLESGTEGIVVKKLDGIYRSGSRDFNWIKYKKSYGEAALADTIDAVVLGYDVGQGKRVGFGIGDFLIGVYDPKEDKYKTVAKIGTGLTDDEWRRIKKEIDEVKISEKPENYEVLKGMEVDVWAKPKLVVEIQADEITKSPIHTAGYALRFPRLISFREKKPEDATTLPELQRLFKLQSR